jgi:hypothetical protein
MAIEPSPQACLVRAYAALQALDMGGAEQHVAAGFQHVLHRRAPLHFLASRFLNLKRPALIGLGGMGMPFLPLSVFTSCRT